MEAVLRDLNFSPSHDTFWVTIVCPAGRSNPSLRCVLMALTRTPQQESSELPSCSCEPVQTFNAGSSCKLLTKNAVFRSPDGGGTLVCAGDEASNSTMVSPFTFVCYLKEQIIILYFDKWSAFILMNLVFLFIFVLYKIFVVCFVKLFLHSKLIGMYKSKYHIIFVGFFFCNFNYFKYNLIITCIKWCIKINKCIKLKKYIKWFYLLNVIIIQFPITFCNI